MISNFRPGTRSQKRCILAESFTREKKNMKKITCIARAIDLKSKGTIYSYCKYLSSVNSYTVETFVKQRLQQINKSILRLKIELLLWTRSTLIKWVSHLYKMLTMTSLPNTFRKYIPIVIHQDIIIMYQEWSPQNRFIQTG